jgi:hypothetical protein
MFDWEIQEPDTARKRAIIETAFLKDSMISYFDEGAFVTFIMGNPFEFQYFNPHTNELYFKLRGIDSIRVLSGTQPIPGQTPLLDAWEEVHTDTILGYVCNKLTLKFKEETRTYLYSPQLATNPEWYQKTKAFNYDVIYKKMKAYYLSMRCVRPEYSFTLRATHISPGEISADIFPKLDKAPLIR